MREFTKTVKDSQGTEVTLIRATDNASEATTMLASGWEAREAALPPAVKPVAGQASKPAGSKN